MNQSHTPQASIATFTPTHTAEGRKLTRAERKAANKAKWAAMQAAKASKPKASKPKPECVGMKAPDGTVTPLLTPEQAAKAYADAIKRKAQAPKPKRKPTANERMEARAQRESIRKQEGKRAKEQAKATIVVGADGGEAQVCERRIEVPAPPKQERKRPVLESEPLSDYDGLTLEEASRLRLERYLLEDVCMDDCL